MWHKHETQALFTEIERQKLLKPIEDRYFNVTDMRKKVYNAFTTQGENNNN
jgi:hypothetical protein